MVKEILAVPEQHLQDTIAVIRTGLHLLRPFIHKNCADNLEKWCEKEEEYLKRLQEA